MKGILKDVFYDFSERKTQVLLKLDGNHRDDLFELKDKDLSVEIKKYRKHRSKDANAYYWTLASKLAEARGITNAEMHNELLRKCSIPWTDENGDLKTWFIPAKTDIDSLTEYHFDVMEKDWINGELYIKVYLLLPSHLMDTKQMARLIDETVSECKEAGIETLPPDELERLISMWGEKREKEKST